MSNENIRLGQKKCPECGMITSSSINDRCFCDREFKLAPTTKQVKFEPSDEPEIATMGAIVELMLDSQLNNEQRRRISNFVHDRFGGKESLDNNNQ